MLTHDSNCNNCCNHLNPHTMAPPSGHLQYYTYKLPIPLIVKETRRSGHGSVMTFSVMDFWWMLSFFRIFLNKAIWESSPRAEPVEKHLWIYSLSCITRKWTRELDKFFPWEMLVGMNWCHRNARKFSVNMHYYLLSSGCNFSLMCYFTQQWEKLQRIKKKSNLNPQEV